MIDDDRASGECDVNAFPTWQNETVPFPLLTRTLALVRARPPLVGLKTLSAPRRNDTIDEDNDGVKSRTGVCMKRCLL